MSKFKITRRYSLKDLGDGWEECYLDLTPFTIRELNKEVVDLASFDQKDPKSVASATKLMLEVIKKHFVGGRALTETGVVDVTADDIEEMPAQVLGGILSFLSAGTATSTGTPSQS